MRPSVVLFAREPEAGRSKTPLAADLGEEAALRLYEAVLDDLARPGLLSEGWLGVVAHPGARPGPGLLRRFPGLRFRPQGPGGPGEQAWRAAAAEAAVGAGAVAVVTTAVPALSQARLAEALEAVGGRAGAALAPSASGGVPLLALGPGADPGFLLGPVRWGSGHAFADLLARAAEAGLAPVRLPGLAALERGSDLAAVAAAAAAGAAPRTLDVLRAMEAA